MELLNEVLTFLMKPVVIWCCLAMIVGQIAKTQIWTRERAHAKGRMQWMWWWGRKTMALHPFVGGVIIGLVWPGDIEAGYVGGTLTGALYFGVGGMASVWAFETLKGLAKKKGIDIGNLPGIEETVSQLPKPPPLPKEEKPEDSEE